MITVKPWSMILAQQMPSAAIALQAANVVDPTKMPIGMWLAILGWSFGGWFCSSLTSLAKIPKGTLVERLEVARRLGTSLFIGVIFYFLARKGGLDEFFGLVFAFLAAWAGDAAVNALLVRFNIIKPPDAPPEPPAVPDARGANL